MSRPPRSPEQRKKNNRLYYEKHHEQALKNQKEYAVKNREKIAARCKAYYEQHKEQIDDRAKQYWKDNREKRLEYKRAYNAAHAVERNEKQKAYYKEHRAAKRTYDDDYYSKKGDIVRKVVMEYKRKTVAELNAELRKVYSPMVCCICGGTTPKAKLGVYFHEKNGNKHTYYPIPRLEYYLAHPNDFVLLCDRSGWVLFERNTGLWFVVLSFLPDFSADA